jgi:scyllo-inosamine 4-kinase
MDPLAPELRQDPVLLAHIAEVAASVLRTHGDDLQECGPTGGWVHPGWMSDRFVIRVGLVPGKTDLRREARIAATLPAEVGYPEVVESGVLHGHEYMVTRRIAGTSVSSAWPTLGGRERADALRELWALAEHVHQVNLSDVEGMDVTSSPFYAQSLGVAVGSLEDLGRARILSERQIDNLVVQLQEFYDEVGSAQAVLNHGDLYIGNAIWDGSRVVSLVDFEFAVIAPVELDLNELAKHVFGPVDAVGDQAIVLGPARRAVLDAAVALPVRASLLKGYAVLLESWLASREIGRRSIETVRTLESCSRLVALADEDGGHLAPLLDRR